MGQVIRGQIAGCRPAETVLHFEKIEHAFYFLETLIMRGLNSLLDTLMLRAAAGPMHRFTFRPRSGLRGRDVEKILLDHGIAILDRRKEEEGQLSFAVRRAHAEWAEFLLCRAGVDLTSQLLDDANARLLEPEATPSRPAITRLLDALLRLAD